MRRSWTALLVAAVVWMSVGLPRAGASILEWRWSAEDGVAQVLFRDRVVMEIGEPLGGVNPGERAGIIVDRLYRYLRGPIAPDDVRPAWVNGQAVVLARGQLVATAGEDAARSLGISPERLAWEWANELRRAIGFEALADNPLEPAAPAGAGAERRGVARVFTGIASWYGAPFIGRTTANGEIYTGEDLTAAHRELPFGTRVRVTNLVNGRSTVVRINDRGPFVTHREIDLSQKAARTLGMVQQGVGPVRIEVLVPQIN